MPPKGCMFTQVYFHKTRVIFDYHLQQALAELLPGGCFPRPSHGELEEYLRWDDWRVLGRLSEGGGCEHGTRLATRNHYREITHTPETPSAKELRRVNTWRSALGDLLVAEIPAQKSWYKTDQSDVLIIAETPAREVKPLSTYSSIVKNIKAVRQVRLYAVPENIDLARFKIKGLSL